VRQLARSLVPVAGLLLLAAQPVRADAPATTGAANTTEPAQEKLPSEHVPLVSVEVKPQGPVSTGDAVNLTIRADAMQGDDVTVPEQAFSPFEVLHKNARVEPAKDGRQAFVFELELLALDAGKPDLPGIDLRVVTKQGFVGNTKTQPVSIVVRSPLGNEPNAKLKNETKPVVVTQDDYRPLYVLGGLGAIAVVALITWLVMRYLARREKPLPPPPPPRPPWDIAVEKLAELRRRKARMIDEGQAAQFVDQVSDVVREYLGGRFHFDGLETTTDEMLAMLRERGANLGLLQEVGAYLRRCDLVKFAKVEPDADEADLVFAKAQDIVQFSMPAAAPGPGSTAPSQPPAAPPPAGGPST